MKLGVFESMEKDDKTKNENEYSDNTTNEKIKDTRYPIIALRNVVLFPHETLRIDVARKQYLIAVKDALDTTDRYAFFTAQKDPSMEYPSGDDLYSVGTIGRILKVVKLPDNEALQVIIQGDFRAKAKIPTNVSLPYATVKPIKDKFKDGRHDDIETAAMRKVRSLFYRFVELTDNVTPDTIYEIEQCNSVSEISLLIPGAIYIEYKIKQSILQETDPMARLEALISSLMNEIHILEIENELQHKLQERLDRGQREYYLREQMHLIAEELGETDSPSDDAVKYRAKITESKMPEDCKKTLLEEVNRFRLMPVASPDANVIRSYLDRCLELPWGIYTKDQLNLSHARKILDTDHYGLSDVKERIIELIAARTISPNITGQILCLVGPPGVGKTSIVRSIARALGREYRRIALGGVRDEAEIRGHRRTYVGAIPGRIINAITEAGSSNPVILLDEVDKLSSDFKGDPASALLEVLDGEQNNSFRDHYIDMPFDLSRVLFITTANDISSIPEPLRDRMEIIELYSYTAEEKFHIAKSYLVKKQMKAHNLTAKNLRITDSALRLMIDGYTREAGVRQLERLIAKLCRKTTVFIVEMPDAKITVNDKNLEEFLGIRKFREPEDLHENAVGLVNGLAWTSVGGELLQVETAVVEGTGKIELTGSLGEVMKESARAAVTFVRSRADQYGFDHDFYKNRDIHIHVPEGAVPKDGPSAGVTITTCLVSALTGIPVLGNVAMTGEITLRGRVLPIGGLKEKSMAAYKAGMKTVLIPHENLPDLEKIDDAVKEKLTFIPVKTADEVLEYALVSKKEKPAVLERSKRKDFLPPGTKNRQQKWVN